MEYGGRVHQDSRRPQWCVMSVAIDGDRIVSGSDDNTIKIWNTEGECIKTLEGHSGCVYSVAIDGDRIVSGSEDNTIKIWNTEGECIKTLEGHSGCVMSVAIDGDRIVSGSNDKTIKIWDVKTGKRLHTLDKRLFCMVCRHRWGPNRERIRRQHQDMGC